MLSLWAIIYEKRIYDEAGRIKIPFKEIYIIFSYLILAPAIGFILKVRFQQCYQKLQKCLPLLTPLAVIMQLLTEIFKGYAVLYLIGYGHLFLMIMLLTASGFVFGAVMSFITRHQSKKIVAIALDAGMRNTLVSHALLSSGFLDNGLFMHIKIVPVLASFTSLLTVSLFVLILKIHKIRLNKYSFSLSKRASTESETAGLKPGYGRQSFLDQLAHLKVTEV